MSTQSRLVSSTARRRRIIASLPAVLVALTGTLLAPAAAHASPGVSASAETIPATVTSSGTSTSAGTGAGTSTGTKSTTKDAAKDANKVKAAVDDEAPSLTLELPDYGVVADEVTASVTLTNPSDGNPLTAAVGDPLPAGRIVLERADKALSSRTALSSWLSGATHPTMSEIAWVQTEEVAVGGSTKVELTADVAGDDGVYPLTARFVPDDGADDPGLADSTVLTRNDGAAPDVTLVVPVTAPASSRGLLTAEQLESLTAPEGDLRATLDAVSGTDAVLAVDPAIPAAIRVLGTAAPTTAAEWLDDLITLPNNRFALQFGDADAATQLADDGELLEPTSLAPYIAGAGDVDETGIDTETETAEPDPGETPSPEADPVDMSMKELLDIGRSTPDVYWPDPAIAGAETVSAIADLGGTALMSSDATSAGQAGKTVTARAGEALVYDADASTALTKAASTSGRAARSEALTETVADLWLAADGAKGADLLVALDRTGGVRSAEAGDDDGAAPTERTADALSAVTDAVGAFDAAPLRALVSVTPRKASFADDGEPFRTGTAKTLAEQADALDELGSALSDPELLTGRARAEQLQLLGTAWSGSPELWNEAYDAHLASLDTLRNSVGLVPPSDVNLLSSQAPLPVWIRNDLPYPVTVTLYSYPDDVRLSMDTSTEVEVSASSNTRVQLPVKATLGSGDVSIRLRVESPTGVAIGDAQVMNVTVRADWERYGVAGLIALIVLLVVAGTVRTVLRRRKRRRAAAPDGAVPDDAAPGTAVSDEAAGQNDPAAATDDLAAQDPAAPTDYPTEQDAAAGPEDAAQPDEDTAPADTDSTDDATSAAGTDTDEAQAHDAAPSDDEKDIDGKSR